MKQALLLAGAVALVAGCKGPSGRPAPVPPAPLVVTVAPPESTDADPVVGLPAGSRLLLVDPRTPGAAPVTLSDGLAAAGDACVSHDAARIAFVARRTADAPWTVWTCRADGSERRPAVESAADCASPAWLPDGRLVYCAATDEDAPVPAFRRSWALYVAAGDGSPGQRITFGAGLDLDPAVLADGRVVYASWRPPAAGGKEGRFALFTVHPDGSGAALFHGPADGPAVLRRPRPAVDGSVLCTGGATPDAEAALRLDARWPFGAATPVAGAARARVVQPTARGGLLVAGRGGAGERASADGPGALEALPGVGVGPDAVLAVVDVEARPRPQGHLSFVDPFQTWGQLLAADARFPGAASADRVRVRHYDGAVSTRVLGEAPLAPDGSFFLRVPPDVPLLVDLLDASGKVVSASTTPIWVRPRETRGCVGCHEDPDVAPPNRRPAAVLEDAVDWSGAKAKEEASR